MNSFDRVSKEQRDQLRAPLPTEAIKPHPTKTYLSSIKPIFVIERLNDVFGIGSWKLSTDLISNNGGVVVVKSSLSIEEYNIYLESFGGNDNGGENSKNFDLGDAFKGATTDSFTKIASYLEIGIDVFKGKGNKPTETKPKAPKSGETPKPKTEVPTPKKDELTPEHKSWNYVLTRLKEKVPMNVIKESFTISTENEDKLIKSASLAVTTQIANP
jgi:hypothetical protein